MSKGTFSDVVVRIFCNIPLRKHAYVILTPFYIVKLRFIGVYVFLFLFLLKNIDYEYSLEPPRRGGSNEYPQSMF